MRRLAGSLLLVALLAACGTLRDFDPGRDEYWRPAGSFRPLGEVESLLVYYEYARGLNAADWQREHEQVKALHAAQRSDFRRVQYALLLAAPAAPARELARLPGLLDPLIKAGEPREPGLRGLALLLAAELQERRRLEERGRDEARRADELERKLDALKAIESQIQQRERKK